MATAAGQHQQLPLSPPSATGKGSSAADVANTMMLCCQMEKETQATEAGEQEEAQGKAEEAVQV